MAVVIASTRKRNDGKRKERKNACSGEPHSGGEGRNGEERVERVGIRGCI
jgi:hypothetical protein